MEMRGRCGTGGVGGHTGTRSGPGMRHKSRKQSPWPCARALCAGPSQSKGWCTAAGEGCGVCRMSARRCECVARPRARGALPRSSRRVGRAPLPCGHSGHQWQSLQDPACPPVPRPCAPALPHTPAGALPGPRQGPWDTEARHAVISGGGGGPRSADATAGFRVSRSRISRPAAGAWENGGNWGEMGNC